MRCRVPPPTRPCAARPTAPLVLLLLCLGLTPDTRAAADVPAAATVAESAPDQAAASAHGHAGLPVSAELVYETTARLRLGGLPIALHARTTTRWQRQGGHYETHLHMDTTAIAFDQDSWGSVLADGSLVPERYNEKRPFHGVDSVQIDWPNRRMQFGSAAPVAAPEAGAQDRLSLQFQLAQLRHNFPERFAPGSVHAVQLIGPRDVDPWRFVVAGEEAVDTGRGAMRSLHFTARRTVGGVEESMDVWLGSELQWMPVRIRMVDRKQSVIDSVLQHATVTD